MIRALSTESDEKKRHFSKCIEVTMIGFLPTWFLRHFASQKTDGDSFTKALARMIHPLFKKHFIIPVCFISAWSCMCRNPSDYTNKFFSLLLQVMLVSFMKQDRSIISIRVLHRQQPSGWRDDSELSQAVAMAVFSIMGSRLSVILSSLRTWRVCDFRRRGPAETTTSIFTNQHEVPKHTYVCNSMARPVRFWNVDRNGIERLYQSNHWPMRGIQLGTL